MKSVLVAALMVFLLVVMVTAENSTVSTTSTNTTTTVQSTISTNTTAATPASNTTATTVASTTPNIAINLQISYLLFAFAGIVKCFF
ncbi:hypothetical protein Bpfe_024936 [Biomphalaria pfeifferi]|uniref:Uncharacterized protein n=1 Tax=Biomphalaria pfeifferi TaxID=112525 RepID=A0AAD8B1K6_BIOPF|nr:hypothetical protein Bpfe_024936 [Biomphalaria pfeifferi]